METEWKTKNGSRKNNHNGINLIFSKLFLTTFQRFYCCFFFLLLNRPFLDIHHSHIKLKPSKINRHVVFFLSLILTTNIRWVCQLNVRWKMILFRIAYFSILFESNFISCLKWWLSLHIQHLFLPSEGFYFAFFAMWFWSLKSIRRMCRFSLAFDNRIGYLFKLKCQTIQYDFLLYFMNITVQSNHTFFPLSLSIRFDF